MRKRTLIAATVLTLWGTAAWAGPGYGTLGTTDTPGERDLVLESFEHGQVMNGITLDGVTFGADNFHNNHDLLTIFDTRQRNTRDRDLEGPGLYDNQWGTHDWDRGNLSDSNPVMGNILILQEFGGGFAGYTDNSNTVVNRPDDEGRRRGGDAPGAGEITFSFAQPVEGFGFTLIDIEENGEFNNETGFYAAFEGGGGMTLVSFKDFVDSGSAFYDPSVMFGDNSANRIQTLTADELGLDSIDRVTINLGGSGGVGGVRVSGVPTPGAAFAGLTMLGVLLFCRGRPDRSAETASV